MPKTIKDDSGTDIEVFDKSEYDSALAEKTKAEQKIKELEQELNPNWREARNKMSALEAENERLKRGEKSDPTPLNVEEISRIAEEKANATYLNNYKEEILAKFGDKKDAVRLYFDKLASGESLDRGKIDNFASDAARMIGAAPRSADLNARFGREGVAPRFEPESTDQGFGATEAGAATAKVMGLIINNPNKK